MQTLFAHEFHPLHKGEVRIDPEEILEYVAREFGDQGDRKFTIDASTLAFAYALLNGVLAHQKEIHEIIEHHAPEWPVSKIAPLDRAILEIALFEMLYTADVPAVVAIDEAIELAKSFGSENSPKFVNGVLNAFLKSKGTNA